MDWIASRLTGARNDEKFRALPSYGAQPLFAIESERERWARRVREILQCR